MLQIKLTTGTLIYFTDLQFIAIVSGLLELEASLPEFVMQPRVRPPRRPATAKGFVKRKQRRVNELAEIHKVRKLRCFG